MQAAIEVEAPILTPLRDDDFLVVGLGGEHDRVFVEPLPGGGDNAVAADKQHHQHAYCGKKTGHNHIKLSNLEVVAEHNDGDCEGRGEIEQSGRQRAPHEPQVGEEQEWPGQAAQ